MLEKYLDKSLLLANGSYNNWNYPIWALLVVDDNIHIEWQNRVVSEMNDRHHAEIDIINKASDYTWKKNKKILFVTMEPCNNCAKALVDYWVDEVYYILEDPAWWWKSILELAWIKIEQVKYKYDEYLDLVINFMTRHWWYNEVLAQYKSIKENWENTYEKQLNKIIENNFINISEDLPDYKVRKIVYNNTLTYLKNALLRTPQDKHEIIFQWYYGDMERIISYCVQECVNKDDFRLSTDFIKWLHKTLYPAWFSQKHINEKWKEVVWMIPWEYRTINLESTTNPNKKIYCNFSQIELNIEELLLDYNNEQSSRNFQENILFFMADFSRIHPFWDGNGRLIDILVDLLLLKNNLKPFYLWLIKNNDKVRFYKILDEVHETRDLQSMFDFIEKYSKQRPIF